MQNRRRQCSGTASCGSQQPARAACSGWQFDYGAVGQEGADPLEDHCRKLCSQDQGNHLAVEISRRYPGREGKDQILEWYLNYNSYGNFAYGVEAAAQVYFSKSVADINLAEAAMIAAIPQYPGLNPIDNPEWAQKRQRIALDAMVEAGYITQAEADQAFAQELVIRPTLATRFEGTQAPHFSLCA